MPNNSRERDLEDSSQGDDQIERRTAGSFFGTGSRSQEGDSEPDFGVLPRDQETGDATQRSQLRNGARSE